MYYYVFLISYQHFQLDESNHIMVINSSITLLQQQQHIMMSIHNQIFSLYVLCTEYKLGDHVCVKLLLVRVKEGDVVGSANCSKSHKSALIF